MSDLISRRALVKGFTPAACWNVELPAEDVIERIEAAPAVDAVEVVRCGGCDHMTHEMGGRFCNVWERFNGMGDEGFCNYGERKAE